MLVLSRRKNESIVIGSDIVITVLSIDGHRVKIGIDAPSNVRIRRSELPPIGLEAPPGHGALLQDREQHEEVLTAAPSVPR